MPPLIYMSQFHKSTTFAITEQARLTGSEQSVLKSISLPLLEMLQGKS